MSFITTETVPNGYVNMSSDRHLANAVAMIGVNLVPTQGARLIDMSATPAEKLGRCQHRARGQEHLAYQPM